MISASVGGAGRAHRVAPTRGSSSSRHSSGAVLGPQALEHHPGRLEPLDRAGAHPRRVRHRRRLLVLGWLAVVPPDELGLAPLGERNLDRVEVAREHGPREDRARLVADEADRVAGREVREREHRHAGLPGECGRLGRGRVAGLGRPVVLLLGERRLVQQQVGLVAGDLQRLAGRGVARDNDLAPRARRPEHLLRANAADYLAPLQLPELGSLDHAERGGGLRVELPGPLVLVDHVPERLPAAMRHRHRRDRVAVAGQQVTGRELDQLELVADPAQPPAARA